MNRAFLLSLAAACFCSSLCAQESKPPAKEAPPAAPSLPPEAHPWGRFPVGSWKTVRMTTESLDSQGRVVSISVTNIKTTLIQANDSDYQLKIETTTDIGGKRFIYPAQTTRHSYWGELGKPVAGVQKVTIGEVELNGKKIACELRQVLNEQASERRQSIVHYAATQYPYLLKRESSVTPATGTASSTTVEVIATNLPQRVLGVLRSVAYVRTNHQNGKGSSTTMEVQSADIPGGVVSHAAQERDAASTITRRTALEVLEYGIGTEPEDQASPYRRRYFRQQRRQDRRDR
jgi:hypothetical protein